MSYTDTFSRIDSEDWGDLATLIRTDDATGRTVRVNMTPEDGQSDADVRAMLDRAMARAWAEPVPVQGKDQPERPASRRA